MSLNHITISVERIEELTAFYVAALKPLGYKIAMSFQDGKVIGMGSSRYSPDFWLAAVDVCPENTNKKPPTGYTHVAFTAKNRKQVRQFYEAAIAAGAKCNGPPGLRPQYFATYYGAFVLDPDGRNIEAVCMKPGFWAEEWGVVGWGITGLLLSGLGYAAGQYFGLI